MLGRCYSNWRFRVMGCLRTTQRVRAQVMKVLLAVMLATSFYIFWRQHNRGGDSAAETGGSSSSGSASDIISMIFWRRPSAGEKELAVGLTTEAYWSAVDRNHKYTFTHTTDGVLSASINVLKQNLTEYLTWLQHGVRIVSLPNHLSLRVIQSCNSLDKPPLMLHQHGLEITFPKTLREMSKAARRGEGFAFDPLWFREDGAYSEAVNKTQQADEGPLLSYVEAYPYHAVYCTKKNNNKDPHSSREDWTKRDPYWQAVASYITSLPAWKVNMGIDFLAPASHPQLKPMKHHPYSTNYFHRASFLSSDLDVSGSSPKDIVVPYMTEANLTIRNLDDAKERHHPHPLLLLYFSGGDNPKKGLRSRLAEEFKSLTTAESLGVQFVLSDGSNMERRRRENEYIESMASSRFCLIVRGDTTSSRRFFTAVALGCIPVIVSDWIQLPFERLIDYKQFTFSFPEAIASDVSLLRGMLSFLRLVSTEEVARMQAALNQARQLLVLPQLDGANEKQSTGSASTSTHAVLNPVTLTLVEALMSRIEYCRQPTAASLPLCMRIRKRVGRAVL